MLLVYLHNILGGFAWVVYIKKLVCFRCIISCSWNHRGSHLQRFRSHLMKLKCIKVKICFMYLGKRGRKELFVFMLGASTVLFNINQEKYIYIYISKLLRILSSCRLSLILEKVDLANNFIKLHYCCVWGKIDALLTSNSLNSLKWRKVTSLSLSDPS